MRRVRRLAPLAAALALVAAPAAQAQDGGGMSAPDFSEPCPAVYPGDDAASERIARWMARGSADRGLPRELPVMAALVESGLHNLGGTSFAGYFGMSRTLNTGDYRGFRRHPDLQLRWFADTAILVRQRRVAEGRPDPAADESTYGSWIADVERPARQYRTRYQPRLEEARSLIAGKCAAPHTDDLVPPRLRWRIEASQQPLATRGIVMRVRCPDHDCLVGAMVEIGTRTRRVRALEPAEGGYTALTVRIPRAARRALRSGRTVGARVTAIAADDAANTTARHRLVTLGG
jgi:hypothetical protein